MRLAIDITAKEEEEEIIQEEVAVAVAVVGDGKVACDVCGFRFTSRGQICS